MKIQRTKDFLDKEFNNHTIKKLKYENDGNLSVISHDDKVVSSFKTVAQIGYSGQFGTPISEDGKYVFIGTWERGLFCYSLSDGELKWKQGPGKVRLVIPYKNLLVIEMANRGVYVRNADTGELVKVIKMSGIEVFSQISDKEVFVGPKFNKYYIYSLDTLEPLHEIPATDLNINRCLSFVIREVFYKNDELYIEGFEQYKNMTYDQSEESSTFERKVPLHKIGSLKE